MPTMRWRKDPLKARKASIGEFASHKGLLTSGGTKTPTATTEPAV